MQQQIIQLEYELRRLADLIKNAGRSKLRFYEITDIQFIAIQWIKESESLSIGELAKRLNLAISSTSELVDQLCDKGFTERVKNKQDRRKVSIFLTGKGEEIIANVILERQTYLETILSNCDIDNIESLEIQVHQLYSATEEGGKNV